MKTNITQYVRVVSASFFFLEIVKKELNATVQSVMWMCEQHGEKGKKKQKQDA